MIRLGLGLGTRGLEIIGKLALYVLVARQLSLLDAGLYFTALAWTLMGGAIARFGLDRGVMARIPAELAVGDGAAAMRAMRGALLGVLGGGLALGALSLVLGPVVATHVMGQPALAPVLALSGVLLLMESLAVTAACILSGLDRNIAGQFAGNSLWPALALVGLWLWPEADILDAILITIAARLATLLLGLFYIYRTRARFAIRREGPALPLPPLWRASLPLMGVELGQFVLQTLPTLLLAAFVPPETVGAFSMAMRISMLPWAMLFNVYVIAGPRMAEHYRREEWPRLRQSQRVARWTSVALAMPVLIPMIIGAPWLLQALGPGFDQATTVLRVLGLGQAVAALFAMRDALLASTGHGAALLRVNAVQVMLAAALSITLIPLFGAEGAAAMNAIGAAFGALGATWMARRRIPEAF